MARYKDIDTHPRFVAVDLARPLLPGTRRPSTTPRPIRCTTSRRRPTSRRGFSRATSRPCLRDPTQPTPRHVAFFRGRVRDAPPTDSAQMKQRIDAPAARAQYGQRFAIVEPVFANVRYNKGLDRFTRRGRAKVEGPWRLFCLVHHIEKLAHHGHAA